MKKLAILAIFSTFASLALAQTPVSSKVSVGALADIDNLNGTPTGVSASSSQTDTLFSLGASVGISLAPTTGETLDVTAGASAIWTNAAKGSVSTEAGWNFNVQTSSSAKIFEAYTTEPVWSYTFTATSNSVFSLDWDVVGTGYTFGLQQWYFEFDGPGNGASLGNEVVYPDGSGNLTRSLVSGETYTVALTNFGNVHTTGAGSFEGSMVGEFDWEITPVPEPMTCIVLGGGLLALARRRRNRA